MIQKLLKGDEFSPQDRDFINEAAYLIAAYGNTTPEGKYGYSKFKFPYMNSRMELERDNFRRAIGLRIPYWSAVVQHNKNMDILNKYYNNLPGERISLKKISVPKRILFAYSNVSPEDIEMGKSVDLTNEENYRMYRKYPLLLLQYLEGGELKKNDEPLFQFKEKKLWGGEFVIPYSEGGYGVLKILYQELEDYNRRHHNPYFLLRLNMEAPDWELYISLNPKKNNGHTHATHELSSTEVEGNTIVFPMILKPYKSDKYNRFLKRYKPTKKGFNSAISNALEYNDYMEAPPRWNRFSLLTRNALISYYPLFYKNLHPDYFNTIKHAPPTGGGISGMPLMDVQEFLKYTLDTDPYFKENFYRNNDNLQDLWNDFILENYGLDLPLEMWNEKMGWN